MTYEKLKFALYALLGLLSPFALLIARNLFFDWYWARCRAKYLRRGFAVDRGKGLNTKGTKRTKDTKESRM